MSYFEIIFFRYNYLTNSALHTTRVISQQVSTTRDRCNNTWKRTMTEILLNVRHCIQQPLEKALYRYIQIFLLCYLLHFVWFMWLSIYSPRIALTSTENSSYKRELCVWPIYDFVLMLLYMKVHKVNKN